MEFHCSQYTHSNNFGELVLHLLLDDYCIVLYHRTVNPNELVKAVLKSTPMKLGNFKVLVVFSSAQLSNIKGDEDVTVTT